MMKPFAFAVIVLIGLSLLDVIADITLKFAGETNGFAIKTWLILGTILYALTAFGWLYVFKHVEVSDVGILYPLCTLILLVATGVLFFRERLSPPEILGFVLALVSFGLLARFH